MNILSVELYSLLPSRGEYFTWDVTTDAMGPPISREREREEWKDILCMPDSKGKTVAHYVVPQDSRSWHCADTEFYGGPNLRLPTFAGVLALFPTEAFTMEDNNGLMTW